MFLLIILIAVIAFIGFQIYKFENNSLHKKEIELVRKYLENGEANNSELWRYINTDTFRLRRTYNGWVKSPGGVLFVKSDKIVALHRLMQFDIHEGSDVSSLLKSKCKYASF